MEYEVNPKPDEKGIILLVIVLIFLAGFICLLNQK